MDWKALLQPKIREFIKANETADVRELALKKPPVAGWPYRLIIDQIKTRQKAAIKTPAWPPYPDIVFPSGDIFEQASSQATAVWKADLVRGKTFADLTGGAGIDCAAFSKNFEFGHCVEQDETAAALLTHNLKILSDKSIHVHNMRAEDFITNMNPCDVIFIDPQRRNESRKGLFKFEDCSPNVIELLPALRKKCKTMLIKTSPMLDIHQGIRALAGIRAVHVVEWNGECKEVIFVLNFSESQKKIPITATQIDNNGKILKSFTFTQDQENAAAKISAPLNYLYEPGPAFQKAGGFNAIAQHYNLKKLHPHTHLYTGNTPCPDFPGRSFTVEEILPVKREALTVTKANLSIRNFPGDVESLRKKLGLGDGGEDYIFACTLHDDSKALLRCRKAA